MNTPSSEPLYPLITLNRHRLSTDGAGVTTLIAGAGCPLRCRYCINREVLLHSGTPVTAAALYKQVKIDDLYFRATGGGVTFGGGESLLHAAFIRRFREVCGDQWRISVETSLAVPEEQVRIAATCVDEFIVDIKSLNEQIYRDYTGGEPALAYSNLRLLLSLTGEDRIRLRIPQIPGYQTAAQQQKAAEQLKQEGFTRLDLFTYRTQER